MIFNNIEFHNVASMEPKNNCVGYRMLRFPKQVRNFLGCTSDDQGRFVSTISTGCELRFVTSAKRIQLTMSSQEFDGNILIFNGDVFHSMRVLEKGKISSLMIEKNERSEAVNQDMLVGARFSTDVWRIVMGRAIGPSGNFTAIFHDIETFGHEIRAPKEDEKPSKTWLAYGSSITHGSGATNHHLSYVQLTAYYAGIDVLNKGMGGTCFAEEEMIDYLVSDVDWDIGTFEIGVNMRGKFSPEIYEKRLRYLLSLINEKKWDKQVYLITIFPNWNSRWVIDQNSISEHERVYNEIVRKLYKEFKRENLYLIEGEELLTDLHALTSDLIHPSDYGHGQIARNLASIFIS